MWKINRILVSLIILMLIAFPIYLGMTRYLGAPRKGDNIVIEISPKGSAGIYLPKKFQEPEAKILIEQAALQLLEDLGYLEAQSD